MDEELLTDVYQRAMHHPRIDLMEEHFVADKEDAGEHVLDDRISTCTSLVKGIEQLSTSQTLVLNVAHQLGECWK